MILLFFFKQKTAYEMRISDWSSDVCSSDLNLMEGYEQIVRAFPRPEYQVSIVHGKMKPADKDFEMQRFLKGETQIMVATTVIEVGVDVPNEIGRASCRDSVCQYV